MSATEKDSANCMPPEFYIRIWKTSAESNIQPKFKSSIFPQKKKETKNVKNSR